MKSSVGLSKNPQSLSQKTPNWKTGMRATWAVRAMVTSWPPVIAALTCMLMGMTWAHKPESGPELIWPQVAVRVEGQVEPWAVPGMTEYCVQVTPRMEG